MTRLRMTMLVAALVGAGAMLAGPLTHPVEAAKKQTAGKAKASKPLTGKSYYNRRRGGYSYRYSDVVSSTRAQDPSMNRRVTGGPLDGDFFFEQPRSPFGGNTHYMH